MKKVCISLAGLFNEFGENLTYGKIKQSDEVYFDFYNEQGVLSCMDGEECFVEGINEESNYVLLVNKNGELDVAFKLSLKEFETACFVS